MGKDRMGTPHVVFDGPDGTRATSLDRLPLMHGKDEAWLQGILDLYPSLLPAEAIDERVETPLVSLGQEIGTPAGPIDNLFISQNGYLVVVETKLWRNAEARRKVVAQVLDYAAQVRQWGYADLERIWRASGRATGSLWEDAHPEGCGESEWIDDVNENLRRGRMTLLIVGDGIRTEVRQLADAVSGHPDFQFRLGLVEVRLHRMEDDRVLAVPVTMARTQEIERAVVRIEQPAGASVRVEVETPAPSKGRKEPRPVLTEEVFFDELRSNPQCGEEAVGAARALLRRLDESLLSATWKGSAFSITFPDPSGSDELIPLAYVYTSGDIACEPMWTKGRLNKLWGDQEAAQRVWVALNDSALQAGATTKVTKKYEYPVLPLVDLAGREATFVEAMEGIIPILQKEAGGLQGKGP